MGPPQARRRAGALRQGGRVGGVYRIGGVDIAWDPDVDVDKPKPGPLFPSYNITKPQTLSEKERRQVSLLKSIKDEIHHGPLYTVLSENTRVAKLGTTPAATFDSFNGMPKYSQRYVPRRRALPRLDTRSYVLKYFPKEIWPTLDPTQRAVPGAREAGGKRRDLHLFGQERQRDPRPDKGVLSDADDQEQSQHDSEEEREILEEDMDDNYEDEDEGGDYNAEQYFDDGGEDGFDDHEGRDDGPRDYI